MYLVLVHEDVKKLDFKKCKKWYPGIQREISGICRLLSVQGKIAGQSLYHHLPKGMENKTFHASILLPKANLSKRKCPRVLFVTEPDFVIKILYLGGHKDRKYDDSKRFGKEFVRFIENRYLQNEMHLKYSEVFND